MDPSAVGAVGAPFDMDIERGKIREFARAVLSRNPGAYSGEEPTIPPTFLTTTFHWESWTPDANPWVKVNMDYKRGMHAEQEYLFHGPPPKAGDRLTVTSRIAEMYEKQGRKGGKLTFAVKITEFRDASGRLVAEARMTGVETEKPPEE